LLEYNQIAIESKPGLYADEQVPKYPNVTLQVPYNQRLSSNIRVSGLWQ